MARAIVAKIDQDPARSGLTRARATCQRWLDKHPSPVLKEWWGILELPWACIRERLVEDSEEGRRLRQSDPFCGVLTPQERWQIYRDYRETR